MPTNNQYLECDSGLGVIFDQSSETIEKLQIEDLPYQVQRRNVDRKPVKIEKLKVTPNNGQKPFIMLPYHAASGATPQDNLTRQAEQQMLRTLSNNLLDQNPGCEQVVIVGDFNKSAYTGGPGYAVDIVPLTDIANNLTGGNGGDFILEAVEVSEYIIEKQRIAGNLWLNQQANKGGAIDPDSKTHKWVLTRRPEGILDADVGAARDRVLRNIPAAESVRTLGAAGVYTHGSDHSPLRPTPVNGVTIGAHPLIPTTGSMGFTPPEKTYIAALTLENMAAQSLASHDLVNRLREYVVRNVPAAAADIANPDLELGDFIKFSEYLQKGRPNGIAATAHLLANPEALKAILLAWIATPQYQAANALLIKQDKLSTEAHVGIQQGGVYPRGTLMYNIIDKGKDIINVVAEFLDGQVSCGFAPLRGIDPRDVQIKALIEDPASIIVVTENGPGSHKETKADMEAILATKNLHASVHEAVAAFKGKEDTKLNADSQNITVTISGVRGEPITVTAAADPVAVQETVQKAITRKVFR